MTKELRVLIDGDEIGSVIQDARGKLQFDYEDDYRAKPTAIPLSISMPLSPGTYGDKAIKPFMWGLLPDNDDTLSNWGRRFGVNPRNPFALLGEIGEDFQLCDRRHRRPCQELWIAAERRWPLSIGPAL